MIDRYKLVQRHNPILNKFQGESPLSLGNGEFAFTADLTGFQTFPKFYQDKMPLCTMSQWGWHIKPADNQEEFNRKNLKLKEYQTYGRKVAYPTSNQGQEDLFNYLRQNPHKFNLAQIGLNIKKEPGNDTEIDINDLEDMEQTLDMWSGC
ncbi:MAG: glycoside hydrolase family 65, partial [bacterium]